MAIGTLVIACTPGYRVIGVFAPLIVVLGRLLQGFSAGVEVGGASVYLSEMATPGHRGFYCAWQSASQQIAVVFAALLGVALSAVVSPVAMVQWGWRVPFLIGCLIVPLLFWLRRSLAETEAFLKQKHHPGMSEVLTSLAANWKIVGIGVFLSTMTTVSFYLITAYTPTFGIEVLHLTSRQSLMVTLCVGLSNFFWLPVWGAISDRIGRKPILIGFTVLTILTAYPALRWLVAAPSFEHMLAVELWLSFLYGSYNGAMVVALTEVVPSHVRAAGFSLAYSLATTLGGSSLAISTWLIRALDDKAAPGIWMTIAAVCGLLATLAIYQRKTPLAIEAAAAA
jgi:MFS family permease